MAWAGGLCFAIGGFAHEAVVLEVVREEGLRGGETSKGHVDQSAFDTANERRREDKSNRTSKIGDVGVMIDTCVDAVLLFGFGL